MSADNTGEMTPSRLRFWGVRGSIPTPGPETVRFGGNTSCVEVRLGGEILILDAGTGIRLLGDALDEEFRSIRMEAHLLLSHTHWDHIQGLPFFTPLYRRDRQLQIWGAEGARIGLERILTEQMERPHFPISMSDLPGSISITEFAGPSFNIGPVSVSTLRLNHPGGCTGYRLEFDGTVVAYLTDNEPHSFRHGDAAGSSASVWSANQELIDFIADADVAIMDAQYQSSEYESHVGWGHACVDDVVRIAAAGQVGQLYLFHHDPYHCDENMDQMVEGAQSLVGSMGSGMKVDAAREGVTVPLLSPVGQSEVNPA